MSSKAQKTAEKKLETGAQPRPPIVVVMGHVDHGKTSLLDYIRKMAHTAGRASSGEPRSVAEREAGGITQAVGSYEVEAPGKDGKKSKITFIDTPGHEAFSKMRSRGATVADVAILVVAADEGVKPQTKESIKILKDTNTDYVVAITKIDRNNADIESVKTELANDGVLLEGFGGNVSWQGVSVKTGEGVEDLLELILLHAEMSELTYDASLPGRGFVIEAHKESNRGVVVSVVIKNGTLREGDKVATESSSGRAKSLENFLGKRVKELVPSAPAAIVGFETMPKVGEEFWVGEPQAGMRKEAAELMAVEETDKLKAILKAETAGSLEALKHLISPLAYVVTSSVGDITSGDVRDAENTGSVIIAFGVKADRATESQAQISKVKIFSSKIVYELVKEIELFLKRESAMGASGELTVLKVFDAKGRRQLVGCRVSKGVAKKRADVEIVRGGAVVATGRIANLQSGKKDVDEVSAGECGVLVEADTKVSEGDIIKVF